PGKCALESHFHSHSNCRSKNPGKPNFELLYNGLLIPRFRE
ncbi:unnamed protein product, partial [Callosobruchus maculatus]